MKFCQRIKEPFKNNVLRRVKPKRIIDRRGFAICTYKSTRWKRCDISIRSKDTIAYRKTHVRHTTKLLAWGNLDRNCNDATFTNVATIILGHLLIESSVKETPQNCSAYRKLVMRIFHDFKCRNLFTNNLNTKLI